MRILVDLKTYEEPKSKSLFKNSTRLIVVLFLFINNVYC